MPAPTRLLFPLAFALGLAAPAAAVPVDLGDPSLRAIRVALEATPCDPVAGTEADCRVHANDPLATFGTVLDATFEIVAGEAIVTIAAADWELVLFDQQGMGSYAPDTAGVLPGTSSDAVLRFDVATGLPTAWDWTATLRFNILGTWLDIPLAGAIAASPNDVYFTTFFGTDLALNCAEAGAPAPGPGQCTSLGETHQAYDPATGTITALGAVANGIVRPAWAPADWMLSEVPEPATPWMVGFAALGFAALARCERHGQPAPRGR